MALYSSERARTLAQGTVPAGGTTAYIVDGGSAVTIRHMVLSNKTAGSVNYNVYRNGTSDAYHQKGGTVLPTCTAEFDGAMDMGGSEYIHLTGAGLAFTISGVEYS